MRRPGTLQRTEERVRELIDGFAGYIETFEGAGLFTGPSLYFHSKTLERLRQHPTAMAAINDQLFRETLYATLTSWGLHRMGPGNARLVDFAAFEHGLIQAVPKITRLASLSITTLRADEVPGVTGDLWAIIHSLKVGVGETKIVSGSRTLHHLLPDLMPPIDREYTIRFFLSSQDAPLRWRGGVRGDLSCLPADREGLRKQDQCLHGSPGKDAYESDQGGR